MNGRWLIRPLRALPGEQQSDVGADEEASAAEMQDANWTNCCYCELVQTWRNKTIESNRRRHLMDRQRKGKSEKSLKNSFPNPSSQAWSQSHLQSKFTGVVPFHLHICADERAPYDTRKLKRWLKGPGWHPENILFLLVTAFWQNLLLA